MTQKICWLIRNIICESLAKIQNFRHECLSIMYENTKKNAIKLVFYFKAKGHKCDGKKGWVYVKPKVQEVEKLLTKKKAKCNAISKKDWMTRKDDFLSKKYKLWSKRHNGTKNKTIYGKIDRNSGPEWAHCEWRPTISTFPAPFRSFCLTKCYIYWAFLFPTKN